MTQSLLEMAKELVTEQIRKNHVSSDAAQSLLRDTHATLQNLHRMEVASTAPMSTQAPEEDTPDAWKRSITKYTIRCMECGDSFKQLSTRHLRIHDLDARAYRVKYGIPRTQALSSLTATARRRELARQIRPWEKAASMRSTAKNKAKTSAKK
ncbi:MAG: hypothetical protein ETSY2_11410 [Candidatus Entotheonella gemina]|uniref:MucR family transcriptional regulator n=1 Tax=Candidatus Entotheonella gemina TaxID=1429439 RepID=W4MBX0_9BACT|nr:MAG: hypothetical protein ETSY2_11410 [Candidatus Entotheonella gemina]